MCPFYFFFFFQIAVHLVAPTKQEKAAWITDISQVMISMRFSSMQAFLRSSPKKCNNLINYFFQCMDNVHFNGLFYNTMPNATSSTLPQCVKSDPNLFKDDVDIRFSKTFSTCKVCADL